jgi:hypothetical protein
VRAITEGPVVETERNILRLACRGVQVVGLTED